MVIHIDMDEGTAICGVVKEKSISDLWKAIGDFLVVERPATAAITTTPVFNEKGEIQLVDGSWADPNTITDPNHVHMKVSGSRHLAFDVRDMMVNKDKIKTIREMQPDEREKYDAARKTMLMTNSKLQIGTQTIEGLDGN